jgi:hypothetical protein
MSQNQKLTSRVDEHGKRLERFKEFTPKAGDPMDELAAILMAGLKALVLKNYAAAKNCFEVALDEVAKMQDDNI